MRKTTFVILSLMFGISTARSEEAAPPVESTPTPAPMPIAGYDNGFFIQSPDGVNRLTIGGYLQAQYSFLHTEAADDISSFRVRRARLIFSGTLLDPRLNYMFEYDFSSNRMLSAYGRWAFSDALRVEAGQSHVPFNYEGLNSSSALQFVDRSILHLYFGIPDEREPGASISGKLADGFVEYGLGIFNGEGVNTLNLNNEFRYAGRVNVNLQGKPGYEPSDFKNSEELQAALGLGLMYNDTPDPSTIPAGGTAATAEKKVTSLTPDVTAKYRGASFQGMYIYQRNKPDGVSGFDDHGALASLAYFLIPSKLEGAVRGAKIWKGGGANDQLECILGLNGYFFGNQRFKLQGDYSYLVVDDGITAGDDQVGHRVRIQLQVKI